MGGRSEIVDLYERDLRAFKSFTGLTLANFCKKYGLSGSVFYKLAQGHSASLQTIERMYAAMDDAGFISERRKRDFLIHEAERGNITEVLDMVKRLAGEQTK